jgi:hypothetical protein
MGARLLHGTTLFRGCSACLLEEGTMCVVRDGHVYAASATIGGGGHARVRM